MRIVAHLVVVAFLSAVLGLSARSLVVRDARFGWGMFGENTRYLVAYRWIMHDGTSIPHFPGEDRTDGRLPGRAAKVGHQEPESMFETAEAWSRRTRYGIGAVRRWVWSYQRHAFSQLRPQGAVSLEAKLFYAINCPLVVGEAITVRDQIMETPQEVPPTPGDQPSSVEVWTFPTAGATGSGGTTRVKPSPNITSSL